jgi:hypothetical protein
MENVAGLTEAQIKSMAETKYVNPHYFTILENIC